MWKRALKLADADWAVSKKPLFALVSDPGETGLTSIDTEWSGPSNDFFGLVRDDNCQLLYVVGGRYPVIQNAELFQLAERMADAGSMSFVTSWVFRGGRVVGCTLQLPDNAVVGDEQLPTFVHVLNWHGGGALEVHVSFKRMLGMVTLPVRNVVHLRHTTDEEKQAKTVKATGVLVLKHIDTAMQEFNKLLARAANQSTVLKAYEAVWEKPKDSAGPKAVTRWKNRMDEIIKVWDESPNLIDIRDTQWGVYLAFIEWSQWNRKFRGSGGDPELIEQLRGEEILLGQARSIGEEVFDFLCKCPATTKSSTPSNNTSPSTRKVVKKKVTP